MDRVVALGEVLWDIFDDSPRLGGAPLNFGAHAARLGHEVLIASALGEDELGQSARRCIEALGLSTRLIQSSAQYPTGTSSVSFDATGHTAFQIRRPAAYDALRLTDDDFQWLSAWNPQWLYHGSLFLTTGAGANTLRSLIKAFPRATRFYDVNLRPGYYRAELLLEFLPSAAVVKLNEEEMIEVARIAGLPSSNLEAFCREGARGYGWQTCCVTLGAQGCAVWMKGQYEEAPGFPITLADPVGAGDGFSAALLYGLSMNWDVPKIAQFANRLGAIIASRPGGIPQWSLAEVMCNV